MVKTWQNEQMTKTRTILDTYRRKGFRPKAIIKGIFGDHLARVITLVRRQKKQLVVVVEQAIPTSMTAQYAGYETWGAGHNAFTLRWKYGELLVRGVVV
jgi:hypothetical protein